MAACRNVSFIKLGKLILGQERLFIVGLGWLVSALLAAAQLSLVPLNWQKQNPNLPTIQTLMVLLQ